MRNFIQVANFDVTQLLLQLQRNDNLWNQHDDRTTRALTAHNETSDIWLRYRPLDQLINSASYNEPFCEFVWYPAYYKLPEIRLITQALMQKVSGTQLGGVLITRIPPGCQVKPHSDKTAWHANYFNTKIYTDLQANQFCTNYADDEQITMKPGESWVFDNCKLHSVENLGDSDRITLITSIRCD